MRRINKVAVLGSGVMGSQIACHLANVGVEVLLLDISPKEGDKNAIVDKALAAALKMNPSPIYSKSFVNRISTGNFDDDLSRIKDCDWVIEVIIEDLKIKQGLYEKVDALRKPGSLITSNTSGIPIHLLSEGRSEDFQKHFCGTHFFNPPRYLKLLEIIPGPKTDPEVLAFYEAYSNKYLGKSAVTCKDTPAFIANRVGIFSISVIFHLMKDVGLTVTDVDNLTGTLIGRAKSATFRTCDVVGIDTLDKVAKNLYQACPDDERRDLFQAPDFINHLVKEGHLGAKSGQGFYKKIKEDGKSVILGLNLETLEYEAQSKSKFDVVGKAKAEADLKKRMSILFYSEDEIGAFYRNMFLPIFSYVSMRIPEISDDLYRIDEAIKAGFGWKMGPFEIWDTLGFEKVAALLKEAGLQTPGWMDDFAKSDCETFYSSEEGQTLYYNIGAGKYKLVPGQPKLNFAVLEQQNVLWKNDECSIIDLGDGVINLAFHSKMNTVGTGIINGVHKAVDMAEEQFKGLVVYNEGDVFSAGANVGVMFMLAAEQELEELDMAVRTFQKATTRLRFSDIPVIVAPHGLCLGGGTEFSLHADKVIAHAETYMGLVEFGVGVIPGGGGTKEFTLRLSDEMEEGDIRTNAFRRRFLTIGQAKVSTSAEEAFELGYLRRGIDEWIVSRENQLQYAKSQVLLMHEKGYQQPIEREDILVLGQESMGLVYIGADTMKSGHYISEHDQLISEKLGYVMSGGMLSEPTRVSEQYLLDLERKKFLELCMQRKTLERMQSLIQKGKIIRN